jgi:beta-glucosidase
MTWGKSLADYPATSPAHPERSAKGVDGKTTFSEGVLVGYRWFDDQKIEPLYPFGFGLSYTKFELSGLKAQSASDGGVDVSVKVRNVGSLQGDEVPQVYLAAPRVKPQSVQFAPKAFAAFERVSLGPGEEREVSMHVPLRAFQYWSVSEKKWLKTSGERTLLVGTSSRALPLSQAITLP